MNVAALVAATLLAVWTWLAAPAVALLPGDEPLYILDALRWSQGELLYQELFFAHPPARVWQAGIVLSAGAPSSWTKIAPILATWVAAGAVFACGVRLRGVSAAVAVAALLLFAPVTLRYGPTLLGVAEPVACASLACWAAVAGRWRVAGALLGIATQWGLHVAVVALPVLALAIVAGHIRSFALGLTAGALPLGLELLWYGQPMWDQVFGYHIRKVTHMAAQRAPDRLGPFVVDHVVWLAALPVAAWRGNRETRSWALAALASVALVLAWPRLQSHYFYLPMPLLAVALAGLWPSPNSSKSWQGIAAAALLIVLALPVWMAVERRPVQRQAAAEMRELSAQVARLAAGQRRTLWGDGALVPLVSLQTGLPVALGDTDLNAQRFATGLIDPASHMQRVLTTKPLLVLVPRHGVDTVTEVHEAALRRCPDATPFASPATGYAGVILDCR